MQSLWRISHEWEYYDIVHFIVVVMSLCLMCWRYADRIRTVKEDKYSIFKTPCIQIHTNKVFSEDIVVRESTAKNLWNIKRSNECLVCRRYADRKSSAKKDTNMKNKYETNMKQIWKTKTGIWIITHNYYSQ